MFCPKCGNKNPDDSRFCIKCGFGFFDMDPPRGEEAYYSDYSGDQCYCNNEEPYYAGNAEEQYYGNNAGDPYYGNNAGDQYYGNNPGDPYYGNNPGGSYNGNNMNETYYENAFPGNNAPESGRSGGGRTAKIVIIAVIIVAVLIAAAVGLKAWGSHKWQSDYDKGMNYYTMKEYDLAADAFSDAIKDNGSRSEAYIARGDSYMGYADQYIQIHYPGIDKNALAGTASEADIKLLYGYYQKAYDDYSKYKGMGGVAADERMTRAEEGMDSLLKKDQPAPEAQDQKETEKKETEKKPAGTDSTYIFSSSNSAYLSESDLKGMSSGDLALARNEIYARHGRMFDNKKYQDYFNKKSWYSPTVKASDFNDSVLNKFEKANIKLISDYEKKLSEGSKGESKDPEKKPAGTDSTYVFANSSSSYLSESDLQGLSSWDLAIARNEIYARHGRIFDNKKYQDYFNNKSWYSPTVKSSDFNDSMLNDYEKTNIKLISDYEKKQG